MLNSVLNLGSNLLTNEINRKSQSKINSQNLAAQKEFAQNSIQWRVNDAKAAGLHPLAALGSNGTTYTPSAVSSQSNSPQFNIDFESKKTQKLQNELLQSQIEAQKLQNSHFAQTMGQNSNAQNGINAGLLQDKIFGLQTNTPSYSSSVQQKDIPDVYKAMREDGVARAIVDDLVKDSNPNHNVGSLDLLGSLGAANKYVDREKGEKTSFEKGLNKVKIGNFGLIDVLDNVINGSKVFWHVFKRNSKKWK